MSAFILKQVSKALQILMFGTYSKDKHRNCGEIIISTVYYAVNRVSYTEKIDKTSNLSVKSSAAHFT